MSSHHIVRDEQEPALIIESINQQQWPIVLQLLEWSPTVVVAQGVLEEMLTIGHKVDIALVALGTFSYWSAILESQQPIEIVEISEGQLIEMAITQLKMRNHRAVNIVTSNTGLFETISVLMDRALPMDTVVFTEDQRHVLSRSMIFKKWLPAFSSLAIMPLKEKTFMKTEGFDTNFDNEPLIEGISLDRKMEGEVTIKVTSVPFLISESLV